MSHDDDGDADDDDDDVGDDDGGVDAYCNWSPLGSLGFLLGGTRSSNI